MVHLYSGLSRIPVVVAATGAIIFVWAANPRKRAARVIRCMENDVLAIAFWIRVHRRKAHEFFVLPVSRVNIYNVSYSATTNDTAVSILHIRLASSCLSPLYDSAKMKDNWTRVRGDFPSKNYPHKMISDKPTRINPAT